MKTMQKLLVLGAIVLAGVLYYMSVLGQHAGSISSISGR